MELKTEKQVRFFNDGRQQNLEFSGRKRDIHWKRPWPVNKIAPELNPEDKIGINDKNRIDINVPTLGRYKVFPENNEPWKKRIIDPGSDMYLLWNRAFLCACILALFADPLFLFLPSVAVSDDGSTCMTSDLNLRIVVTCFRTFADLFYLMNIVIKFRTAYVSPSSRVFGRGELVMDPRMIAWRYLRSEFFIDLVSALPLPQIVIWSIMPATRSFHSNHSNDVLVLIALLQYIPRLYLIFPLSSQIIKTNGVVTKTAWAGAAYNLLLYMLASHVLGAAWYLFSIERQTTCWNSQCAQENHPIQCLPKYLDCTTSNNAERIKWANGTSVFNNCGGNGTAINYGIFAPAVSNNAFSSKFIQKYLFCLWWGLQNLSCYAQTLITTTFIGETTFAILVCLIGLVLFALLIGNMQNYLQSLALRLEEWRLKRRDTEEWMNHRQLPQNLRQRVRKFVQYKWVATRGVDEEDILKGLPPDLRRDIQRHLRLDLVRRVPFFSQMDDQLLDAICERLVSSLCTQGTYIYREGDPVTEMLFIIRGRLESSTTNEGRTGFLNTITLSPGDFCGEELLSWALLPKSTLSLPSSTRTVKALVEVEAFALGAEDLKFVANQFRRLHSKKLQHTFRFYSHHWRTWAACSIQAVWRKYKKRMITKSLTLRESGSFYYDERVKDGDDMEHWEEEEQSGASSSSTSMFAANRRRAQKMKDVGMPKLQKPEEPDFSVEPDND